MKNFGNLQQHVGNYSADVENGVDLETSQDRRPSKGKKMNLIFYERQIVLSLPFKVS